MAKKPGADDCDLCRLHTGRKLVVRGAGSKPADVLFLGEAPGKSEDVKGEPFYGPSGKVLRRAINRALEDTGLSVRFFITNVVACRPPDNRVPWQDEVEACLPRLQEEVEQVNPKKVVLLGKTAKRYWKKSGAVELWHPAYILRKGGVESTQFQSFVQRLREVFKEVTSG